MRNLESIISYSGHPFHGWQIQPHCTTVQGRLQDALARVLEMEAVRTVGASRTDAGVHAHDQHVSFQTTNPIPLDKLQRALNHMLPAGIRVLAVHERAPDFSARYHARAKHYAYFMHNGKVVPPFIGPYVWSDRRLLDADAMDRAARLFEGTRCFRAMQSARDFRDQTETTIMAARVWRSGELVCFEVVGRNFLYHMVRIMVGALVMVGRGEWAPEALADGLLAGDRKAMGQTAPAGGLHLCKVAYGEGPHGFSSRGEEIAAFLAACPHLPPG